MKTHSSFTFTGCTHTEFEPHIIDTEETCPHDKPYRHDQECERELHSLLLAKLYISGDLLLDASLKRKVMGKLIRHIQHCPAISHDPISWPLVDLIWTNTLDRCALRRCVLNYDWIRTPRTGLPGTFEQINSQFLLDFCNEKFRQRRAIPATDASTWVFTDDCAYHDHDEDQDCNTVVKREADH